MTAEPILLLAWLLLAHLVADFVLQPGRMVRAKSAAGSRSLRGLVPHGAVVALCMVPMGLAFGTVGWLTVAVVTVAHALIDRGKVVLTRQAEAAALAAARRRDEPNGGDVTGLGPGWTPWPAALFALDQVAHVGVLAGASFAVLAGATLEPGFRDIVAGWVAPWDPVAVHEAVLRAVIIAVLLIVNVRAGALFVAALVGSRTLGGAGSAGPVATSVADDGATGRPRRGGWTLWVGPLRGRVEADPVEPEGQPAVTVHHASAPPARLGEAIGILERLIVVTFVLARAEAAIGLVIAAKTLARFRQLDDRDFAEYYLLGTLASVAVAVISGFLAAAVLDTLG